jgi:hypothetical protein
MPRPAFFPRANRPRNAPVPPLPHPSWQHGEAAAARPGHHIAVSEFWQRLGV